VNVVPIDETYASRAEAQAEADWLNSLAEKQQEVPHASSTAHSHHASPAASA
jgi:hypothetical protein